MLTGQAKGQGKKTSSAQVQKEQVLKEAQQSEGGMFGGVPVATMMVTLGAAYGAKSKIDELRNDASQRAQADAEWPQAMALVRSVASDFPPAAAAPTAVPKKAAAKAPAKKADKSKAAVKKTESKAADQSPAVQSSGGGASPLGVTGQQKAQLAKLQASAYLQQLVADEAASAAQAVEALAAAAAATDAANADADAKAADAEPAGDSEQAASTSESAEAGKPTESPLADAGANADAGADAGADADAAAAAAANAEITARRAELDELEARARRLRADVVGGVIADEKAHEMALRQELEDRALADLGKLDEAQLRERLVRLVAETSERAQWQAYAHLQTVRHVEAKLAEQNTEMMGMQREKMAATHGLELEEQERRLARGFEDEIEQVKTVADERLADALMEQEAQLKNDSETALERAIGELREEVEAARLSDTEARLAQLERLSQRVSALDQLFDRDTDTNVFSHQVHKLSSATMALSSKAEEAVPLHAEFKLLHDAGQGDDIVELALASLSSRVRNTGAMTTAQLRRRFEDVAQAARKAELAPANTMLGHALGSVFAAVMLRPRGVLDGDDIDARLSRADHHLDAGNLRAAVGEVTQLQGLSADAAQGWLVAARDRLALDQAITLVKTHTTLLAASLR